jgi:hypothetical protein
MILRFNFYIIGNEFKIQIEIRAQHAGGVGASMPCYQPRMPLRRRFVWQASAAGLRHERVEEVLLLGWLSGPDGDGTEEAARLEHTRHGYPGVGGDIVSLDTPLSPHATHRV